MGRRLLVRRGLVFAALLAAALLGGCVGGAAVRVNALPAAPPELARLNQLLADLAERLKPAVVQVRREAAKEPSSDPQESRPGWGSGFIIDPAGVIVTNAHVVGRAAAVQVRLFDGRRFKARVLGRDRGIDLAVVRIDGVAGLPALPLGDSDRARVGELVLALGHPFGLEHTVSFGIVSRKGPPPTTAVPGLDFIQTDAAINPGNSGGPLINMAGEAIGLNSAAARNGSIGVAIPSNLMKTLVPQLLATGHVEWGWLGAEVAEISEEDRERLKVREPRGVLIHTVAPGEPADHGGVRANDVILALDGRPVDGPRELQRLVALSPVGKKVRVTVWRDGQETEVEVTIGKYTEAAERR
jgi:serine protease Do